MMGDIPGKYLGHYWR